MNVAVLMISVLVSVGPRIEAAGEGARTYAAERARPDALLATRAGPAVVWVETFTSATRPGGANACHVSPLGAPSRGPERARPREEEVFGEISSLATCCVDRIVTARVRGDAFLAVTTCSMKDGFWLWSQSLGGLGSKQDTPEPVLPISGRAQHEPRIEPTTGGELWLAWVEGEREADIGGVVRAARLDGSGKIVLGPFDLSDRSDSIALGSSLGDHLAIATTPDGGLVLAWLAIVGEHARGLRMRRIDAAGEAVTPILEATPEGHDRVDSPRLSVDDSGGVSLVWRRRAGGQSDRSGAAGQRLFFRAFTAEGEPRTDAIPFSIDEPERSQDLPRIASVGGRDLLVWTEARDLQEDGWIAVRRWLPGVGPVGLTTRFPASVAWQWPLLEALPDGDDGRFTIFWQPSGPNGFSEPGRLAWRSIDLTASFPGS